MDSFEALGDEISANISIIVPHTLPGDRLATSSASCGRAGEIAVAPPGAAHGFVNSGFGPLRQVDIQEHSRFINDWL